MRGVWLTPSLLLRPLSLSTKAGADGGKVSMRILRTLVWLYWPVLPAASTKAPKLRSNSPWVWLSGLKVAVYSVSLTATQADKAPAPEVMTGNCAKGSLSTRRTVATASAASTLALPGSSKLTVAVGAVASILKAWVLRPAWPRLPTASVWRTCTWPRL